MIMQFKPQDVINDNPYNDTFKDYLLHFQPISNSNGSVRFIDRSRNEEQLIYLSIKDKAFQNRVEKEVPSIIADLVDLAVAISASDRLAAYKLSDSLQRRIHIILPVRHPELLAATPFQEKLKDLLMWSTGTQWIFDFQQRKGLGRSIEQNKLFFPTISQDNEVALWSGGLDSLAGLYTRLKTIHEKSFILFGTGSNKFMSRRQEIVADQVKLIFPNRVNLVRVPVYFEKSSKHSKNKHCRARGVFFTLLGSACAYLMGQRSLSVYENGIGAINLPYCKAAIGLDHSRSVHPRTLLMVSDVVSELLGERFQIKNPFLFSTKAEMCQTLANDRQTVLSLSTMSCDSRHHQKQIQCGYCSSCLLRRQALAAVNIEDTKEYVLFKGKRPPKKPSSSFRHMQSQIHTFRRLLGKNDTIDLKCKWRNLTRQFPELDSLVDRTAKAEGLSPSEMQDRLIRLYQTYILEWETVESKLSVGLLNQYPSNGKRESEKDPTTTPKS